MRGRGVLEHVGCRCSLRDHLQSASWGWGEVKCLVGLHNHEEATVDRAWRELAGSTGQPPYPAPETGRHKRGVQGERLKG